MSNFFDAVAQVYEYIQVTGVTTLLDGRIYQNRFPTDGDVIGEGKERFIVINNLEPNNSQMTGDIPINVNVFCLEQQYCLPDHTNLDLIEKAVVSAIENRTSPTKVGYCAITHMFSHLHAENPFSKKHSMMTIRLNVTINTK